MLLLLDGFRKVISNEAVNLKMDKDDMEFAHQFFLQGQDRLLEFIKRKVVFYLNIMWQCFVPDMYGIIFLICSLGICGQLASSDCKCEVPFLFLPSYRLVHATENETIG